MGVRQPGHVRDTCTRSFRRAGPLSRRVRDLAMKRLA
jgi:hypothetical protein